MDVFDRRRVNLRKLIEQWGGPKPLSLKLGYRNASFLVQMAGPNPNREVTEKTARRIESVLDLEPLSLDSDPQQSQASAASVDMSLISKSIAVVMQTAAELQIVLTPSKTGDIVALVYGDAEANGGSIRATYVKQLLELLR